MPSDCGRMGCSNGKLSTNHAVPCFSTGFAAETDLSLDQRWPASSQCKRLWLQNHCHIVPFFLLQVPALHAAIRLSKVRIRLGEPVPQPGFADLANTGRWMSIFEQFGAADTWRGCSCSCFRISLTQRRLDFPDARTWRSCESLACKPPGGQKSLIGQGRQYDGSEHVQQGASLRQANSQQAPWASSVR